MLTGGDRFIWLMRHNCCHCSVCSRILVTNWVYFYRWSPKFWDCIVIFLFFLIIILQIIQRLLEEKLTALQCAVFDKTLADLKTRIEKVECNKRHKTVLTELQVSVCMLNCILESKLKISSSIFSSKSLVVVSREAVLIPQRERAGGAANTNVAFEL